MTRANARTVKLVAVAIAAVLLTGWAVEPEFVVPRSLNLATVVPTAADLETLIFSRLGGNFDPELRQDIVEHVLAITVPKLRAAVGD